ELDIEECFDGNLCRCTGYRPILDAAKTFADQAWKGGAVVNKDGTAKAGVEKGCGIEDCCKLKKNTELVADCTGTTKITEPAGGCCQQSNGGPAAGTAPGGGCCRDKPGVKTGRHDSAVCLPDDTAPKGENLAEIEKAQVIARFQKYDSAQELIFPPFLVRYTKGEASLDGGEPSRQALAIVSQHKGAWCQRFYRPLTLPGLLAILSEYPAAKLVAGNSEVGVEIKLKRSKFPVQIYVNDIPELQRIDEAANGVFFGANITLARFEHALSELVRRHGEQRTQSMGALRENLRYFAGNQIRNVATVAGNIATASPISDLNPVFLAAGAIVTLASSSGQRKVPMAEFFVGYRRTAMREGEVLQNVFVPFSGRREVVRAFKQAKRKDDDIAIVTCGLRVSLDGQNRVLDAAFAYGGMAPTTVLATQAMQCAVGATWGDPALLPRLLGACQNQLRLDFGVPGGMAEYRAALTTSFMFKFWALSCSHLAIDAPEAALAHEMDDSAERVLSKGAQEYATITERAIVGKGVTHLSALKQVTGEARYIDDMPALQGELYLGLVMSARAHARILSIDACEALAVAGVHRVLTAADVPGENRWNIFHDEEILPTDEVHYAGQPLALVLADSQKIAQEAARLVRIEYEDLPAILTVRDAVAQGALYDEVRQLQNGDVDAAFAEADFVFEGESYCGPQEHFYLETMASIAVPKGEGDEFDIYASTQNPTEAQMVCAEVLGVPASRIVCHVKRMGGGFGGKESRSVLLSAFTALGAYHTNRSVRIMLDRDEDMMTSGQRHPFFGQWKVGVTKDGRLLGLRARIYSNGGFSHDLSIGVLERAVSHLDNCYRIPNTDFVGRVCRTNTQSNTAFRSFGGCQGMFLLESMLCEVADRLSLSVEHLREINLYKEGDVTPFSQVLDDWNVPRMWAQIKEKGEYARRRSEVNAFNAQSRYRKRGLSLLPTKFGISFGVKFLNQGMSLVHVYMDGSVLVAHGGTEMGQGLHTKMAMIAAETLDLPLESIFISETATNTAANT
ncbi:hypothetical protein LPJ66_010290, partial [Kickxella alabastrina]